jgi:hypothetical protein
MVSLHVVRIRVSRRARAESDPLKAKRGKDLRECGGGDKQAQKRKAGLMPIFWNKFSQRAESGTSWATPVNGVCSPSCSERT